MAKKSTVTVNLQRDWFGPNGSLYRARDNPHEFPAEWLADQDDDDEDEDEPEEVAPRLPKSARAVKGSRTVETIQLTADGSELRKPAAVDEDVKSIGNVLVDGEEKQDVSVSTAAASAEKTNTQLGGKPKESGPTSQVGAKK